MKTFDSLRTAIDFNIKENGNQAITGQVMNYVLNEIANTTEEELKSLSDTIGIAMKSVTYAELVALRNSGALVPGMKYRITDYVTTTTAAYTRSGGHRFDIVVSAIDNHTLSEEASACYNEQDSYFKDANADLLKWKLWYRLDNDLYTWADPVNGKGVIYRMIDDRENDCPYDFKNIIYVFVPSFKYRQASGDHIFKRDESLDKVINGVSFYGFITDHTPLLWSEGKCWTTNEMPFPGETIYDSDGNVIDVMGGKIISYNYLSGDYYTFGAEDGSLTGCAINIIKQNSTFTLNWIVFINGFASNNEFEQGCSDAIFGSAINNRFGRECYEIRAGNAFFYNCIGNGVHDISFGLACQQNSIESFCHDIQLAQSCTKNLIQEGSDNIAFGQYSTYNVIERGVSNVNLIGEETAASSQQVQYYHIESGIRNSEMTTIECIRNRQYVTRVGKNSLGEIKQFCLADFI